MALQTKYNVKKLFVIRRMDFRKPGLKTGVKKDTYMKQTRDLKNPAAHPNTNSEARVTPPSLSMGNRVSFIIDLLLNVPMAALFFRINVIVEQSLSVV